MSVIGSVIEKKNMAKDAEAYKQLIKKQEQDSLLEKGRQEGLAASKVDLANAIVSGDDYQAARSMEFAGSTGIFSPEELQGLAVSRTNLQGASPKLSNDEYSAMLRAIANNRQYNVDRNVTEPRAPSASDVEFYGYDGVDVMRDYDNRMDEYNLANANARQYEKGIDQEVANKWRNSFK